MRIPSQLGYVLGGAAALAVLAGCSGAGTGTSPSLLGTSGGSGTQSVARATTKVTNVLPASMQSRVRTTPSTGHIGKAGSCPSAPVGFISDINTNQVYEIDSTGTVCATLTGFSEPQGMATDKSGNLYVANTTASNILEIQPSSGNVIATYSDPGEYPTDVCVANNSGNFAVPAIETTSGGAGNIALYTAGNTSGPTGTASGSTYTSPRFCAFDKQMNAFAFDDYDLFNTGAINAGAILPGNYTGTKNIVPINLSNSLTFPGGVQVNTANQLVIDDQGSGSGGTLYTYSQSGLNFTVSATTSLTQSIDPVTFAFGPGSTLALTADASLAAAQLYKYPAGGPPVLTVPLSGSLPIGAAINPTEQFALR